MTEKIEELVARFQALHIKTGTSKMSSFSVSVEKPMWHGWSFTLGSYDIADWPRHSTFGPYKTFAEMLNALEKAVGEAEAAVEATADSEQQFGQDDDGEADLDETGDAA